MSHRSQVADAPASPNLPLDSGPGSGVHTARMTEPTFESLTIGELARQAGVGVDTIRFYEREGLVPEPDRSPSSGYRQYAPQAVQRVRFIRHAKELGFTLKEVQELLDLRVEPSSTCADVRRRAQEKIAGIEQRIASLEHMRTALQGLANRCQGRGPVTECPILEELSRQEADDGAG